MLKARLRAVALAVALLISGAALAQNEQSPEDLLEDFVHYVKIARVDLAAGTGQKLLQSGLTDAELAQLLDDQGRNAVDRFDEAVGRALRGEDLLAVRDIAAEIAIRVERGRLDLARNPGRIEEAIGMLTGKLRERRLGESRLEAAGEYAVPYLLRRVVEDDDVELKTRARDIITRIGRQAVYPLCVALSEVEPTSQRAICDMLGEIGYSHAAPYLRELALDPAAQDNVRDAASRAFRGVGGVADAELDTLYTMLARQYFDESLSLIAYPYEPMNSIWEYDAFTGLVPTPVPTETFSEIRAMQTAREALRHDHGNETALATFVASNLRRENQLPAGAMDPVFGNLQYTPNFYATVFGTSTALDVLAMALDNQDTPLVRDAIGALSETTGGSNLFTRRNGSGNPLIQALEYPDRRVQYEAALTLGNAHPDSGFSGDFAVVPILASAVRTGNESYAVVIASDPEDVRTATQDLGDLGFTVIASGASVDEVRALIEQSVGVDLAVTRQTTVDAARRTIADLRGMPKSAVAPVLINAGGTEIPALTREFRADSKIHVSPAGVAPEALAAAIDNLMQKAAGGRITEIEAEEYAARALQTLRDIAISGTPAYSIADAQASLLEALRQRSGAARLLVADILAMIDSDEVQQELFDAALSAEGREQVELLQRVAESIKRFGDRADQRHLSALSTLVQNATGEVAEAAALVHGAMNLPAQQAIPFLPE